MISKLSGSMWSINSRLNKIKNKKLLLVFPHPDDESVMAGGLIQRAKELGFWVTVLILTEGNRGKIFVSGKGRSVSEIRRQEMAKAMSRLGVSDWIMWKFDDGKLRRTNKWKERVIRFIRDTDPGIVVTYDLSGTTGHPDHIALSVEIIREFKKHRKFGLWWVSFDEKTEKIMVDSKVRKYLTSPNIVMELSLLESFRKWVAAFAHKSQNLKNYVRRSWWLLGLTRREEWYSEARASTLYKYRYRKFSI